MSEVLVDSAAEPPEIKKQIIAVSRVTRRMEKYLLIKLLETFVAFRGSMSSLEQQQMSALI